jgi:hypothetical protein
VSEFYAKHDGIQWSVYQRQEFHDIHECAAVSKSSAERIASALNQQQGVVEALEKLSITLELVDKYDLSKNVPWPVAELVREARAALAAVNGVES